MDLNAARSWAVTELEDALQSVVEAMVSVRPEISRQALDGAANETRREESIWWALMFAGLPSPSVWVGATVTDVNSLGQSLLSPFGVRDPSLEDVRSACEDLFAQTADAFAQRMSELLTIPVTCTGVTSVDSPDKTFAIALSVHVPPAPEAAVLTVSFTHDFLGRLADVSPADRIADLELCVHATLARTAVPLQDVFKLIVGSVIDLGKTITQPVDLVVNDRVIAQGQVVVCNGNYGVKLTHQLTGLGGGPCRDTN